ncbi:cation-translocating P-type ATPase [Clostridium botulinum]|nr:cation-translocating P-type ATPase [Clostridium botulinum]
MEKSLKIEGMTCAACAKAVERTSKKLEGVTEANVNFATEKLNVNFDENKLSIGDIQDAIEKAGYKAIIESSSKKIKDRRNDLCRLR